MIKQYLLWKKRLKSICGRNCISHLTTYLITGSNRGIGLEFCRQLLSRENIVIATCRSSSHELDDLAIRVESGVDLTSENSILNLKDKLCGITIVS